MKKRGRAKHAATAAASIGLATSGLSSCIDNGAVDPPPPPFICSTFANPASYRATVSRVDTVQVAITIETTGGPALWESLNVSNVQNATLDSITRQNTPTPVMNLTLDSQTVQSVSFDLTATLRDPYSDSTCVVSRTLAVDVASLLVTVSMSRTLPLPMLEQPHIVVLKRAEGRLDLEARFSASTTGQVSWDATGGTIEPRQGGRARWALPNAPGFYQAEVTIDHGEAGIGFDVLAVEVRATD